MCTQESHISVVEARSQKRPTVVEVEEFHSHGDECVHPCPPFVLKIELNFFKHFPGDIEYSLIMSQRRASHESCGPCLLADHRRPEILTLFPDHCHQLHPPSINLPFFTDQNACNLNTREFCSTFYISRLIAIAHLKS